MMRVTARVRLIFIFLPAILMLPALAIMSQNVPCVFVPATLQFAGSEIEQARCLLRRNLRGGVLAPEVKVLPHPFEKLIGKEVKVTREALTAFVSRQKIDVNAIGGPLDGALSTAELADGRKVTALYFVIHDTSSPYLKDKPFPEDFDTDSQWKGNNLSIWLKRPVAHVFVNRLGESITTTPFNEEVRQGWGTKFARDFLKAPGKGLQLHIELLQPRRRDPANKNPDNDLIAPEPGFTEAQYERLALLYIAASVRRGTWLIPAYHSAIDAGIPGAHDDPQNFDLKKFGQHLNRLLKLLKP